MINMLIPIRCFSCGNIIANKYDKFLELFKKKKKEKNFDELKMDNTNIFKELKLKRYCCRRMLLTNIDIIDKLK